MGEDKQEQYEGEHPGKEPGEGSAPEETGVDTSGQSLGGDADSAATGDGPSGGAVDTGTGGDADSSATGAGPSGGA